MNRKSMQNQLNINETAMKQARARMTEARNVDGFVDIARQVYARLGSRKRPIMKHTKAQDRQLSRFR